MTNAEADKLRAATTEYQARQRLGATYRAFLAAAHRERLDGNYYELPLAERERIADEAHRAAVALGLVTP